MWKTEFAELMFGEQHTLDTMAVAADLKLLHMPDILYKYREATEASIQALQEDFLYSSQPDQFNDIFESAIYLDKDKIVENIWQTTYDSLSINGLLLPKMKVHSSEEMLDAIARHFGGSLNHFAENSPDSPFIKMITEAISRHQEKLLTFLQNNSRNMYNICCLSESYDNELMWAHYAGSHKGFCVGYGIKSLNNNMTQLTFPVIYSLENPFNIPKLEDLDASLAMHALIRKTLAWAYEREWRIFFPQNIPTHRESMPTPNVVYLGVKTDEESKEKIRNICSNKKIPVFELEMDLRTRSISPKPCK